MKVEHYCVLEQVLSIPVIVTKEIPDFFLCDSLIKISLGRQDNKFHDRTVMSHVSLHIFCFEIWDHLFMHGQPIVTP